jgi:hypothetical protein
MMMPGGQAILFSAVGLEINEQMASFLGRLYPKEQFLMSISRHAGILAVLETMMKKNTYVTWQEF